MNHHHSGRADQVGVICPLQPAVVHLALAERLYWIHLQYVLDSLAHQKVAQGVLLLLKLLFLPLTRHMVATHLREDTENPLLKGLTHHLLFLLLLTCTGQVMVIPILVLLEMDSVDLLLLPLLLADGAATHLRHLHVSCMFIAKPYM